MFTAKDDIRADLKTVLSCPCGLEVIVPGAVLMQSAFYLHGLLKCP